MSQTLKYVVAVQLVLGATLYLLGYQTFASILLLLAVLDVTYYLIKSASDNFTPKMRLVEVVTKGGDISYQSHVKKSLFSRWYLVQSHPHKDWCIDCGQKELVRVLEAAIAREKAKIVSRAVVPHETGDK